MLGKRFLPVFLLLNGVISLCAQTIFINTGSVWKYNSTGTDLGTAWKEPVYNETGWLQGASQLGFGDGDEATTVPGGPSTSRYPTHYFRHSLSIPNPSSFQAFTLNVKRDDGIIVYVNGAEVFRSNMPAGNISYNTYSAANAADDGNTWFGCVLSPASFISGTNVIAAEVHQTNATSSDISFDMQLTGGNAPAISLTRGPYLQLGTSTGIYFRWRTDILTDSKVRYGLAAGNLNQSAAVLLPQTEHEVQLTGLLPDTKYYYSIGIENLALQGDTANFFITAPATGSEKLTRIWATGDCGTGLSVQTNVRNAYENFVGNNYTDLWLLLGDNAYDSGTDSEYQTKFFEPYMNGKIMRQTALFPAPGNHDYYNTGNLNSRATPYFNNFILPTAAQAGGVASGTEMYYSFNRANIHFISLDSYGTESNKKMYDTTSAQIEWLKQDLAANTQTWTILYWHHPPYTKGNHNSDTENELIEIRDKVLRILDRYKVDLILCGHSHLYERSRIMKGHYGTEGTFDAATHNQSSSTGKYDGSVNSCPYVKSSGAPQNEGIVYVVSGSAGKVTGTSSGYPHNAMYYSDVSQGGSLCIEVEGNRLDVKWVVEDSSVLDGFTILKDVNQTTDTTILQGDTIQLDASWRGEYQWAPVNSALQSVSVAPPVNTEYVVEDGNYDCLRDTFKVKVNVFISGTIATEDEKPVPGVTVVLSGDKADTIVTEANGVYSFIAASGGNYTVTPSKSNDLITNNGVTTGDIPLIRKHALTQNFLSSPYKVIAADANNSGNISTADVTFTRRVVLNNSNTFPLTASPLVYGRLWEFVSSSQSFPGPPYNPFPFPNTRMYINLNSNQTGQNFIGVKVGDVSNNWNPEIE